MGHDIVLSVIALSVEVNAFCGSGCCEHIYLFTQTNMMYCAHFTHTFIPIFSINIWASGHFDGLHWRFSLCSPAQTVKDDTAYTQVSDKPDEPSANQPTRNGSYIAMSPVEAQKCWSRTPPTPTPTPPPPECGAQERGPREQHRGVRCAYTAG